MKPVLIFGTSLLSKLAHYYLTTDMRREVAGFVVHERFRSAEAFRNLPVFAWEDIEATHPPATTNLFMAIGYKSMPARQTLYEEAKARSYDLINIVAGSTYIAQTATYGENNFFMPGVVIEPDVMLGSNNVIWSNATICHDTHINNHNFFASNVTLGGGVTVGSRSFFGFSASVLQGKHIADDVLIGAQSLVTDDVLPLTHVHGAPARIIKKLLESEGVCID